MTDSIQVHFSSDRFIGGPRDRHMILFKSMLRLVGLWQAFVELHVAAVGHLNIMVTAAVTCDRSGQLL